MKFIKRILSIEFLVEFTLSIFVVINFSTISEYFLSSGFNPATSYGAGAVMGVLLMGFALMLSRIEKGDATFNVILVGTIVAAIVASILQTQAYHHITSDWMTSIIKGTGFPILEVSLAYCASIYSTYMKSREELIIQGTMHRKRLEEDAELEGIKRKMTNDAKIKIYRAVAESFDGLQIESIKAEVVPFVNQFAARQGRYIVNEMETTGKQQVDTIDKDVATLAETIVKRVECKQQQLLDSQQSTEIDSQHVDITGVSTTIDEYVDQHPKSTAKSTVNTDKQQRQQQLLELLKDVNGQPSTVLNKKQLATQLNTTDTTVNRDLKELSQQGLININGIVEVF